MKEDLLFYKEYQRFYQMAADSDCFKEYCKSAFGADFSQDGFSDIHQIDLITRYVALDSNSFILDVGCGNGKMVQYLKSKTGAHISGFDYSENAIRTAIADHTTDSDFIVGTLDEMMYPAKHFDLIVSMDSIYFSKDMRQFVKKAYGWLKDKGTFFVGYQEGDIMPRTQNGDSTIFANALRECNLEYQAIDYTEQTFHMLQQKRNAMLNLKEAFEKENLMEWYHLVLAQTDCVTVSFDEYINGNARYIYIVRK